MLIKQKIFGSFEQFNYTFINLIIVLFLFIVCKSYEKQTNKTLFLICV